MDILAKFRYADHAFAIRSRNREQRICAANISLELHVGIDQAIRNVLMHELMNEDQWHRMPSPSLVLRESWNGLCYYGIVLSFYV